MGIFDKLFGINRPSIEDLSRNDPCWCGSGKKYKQCHLERDKQQKAAEIARQCKTG
jgi:uncharacterized protein YecA (UPF0149 family)